jgi:hypothetical protein
MRFRALSPCSPPPLQTRTDLLAGIKEMVKQEKIRNAVILTVGVLDDGANLSRVDDKTYR